MESSGPYFVSNQSKYSDTKLNYPNLHIAKPSASKVIKFLLEGVDSSMWKKLDIFCKKKGFSYFGHCRHQQSVLEPKTYQSVEIQMIDYPFFAPMRTLHGRESQFSTMVIWLNGWFFRNLDHCAKFLPTNQCSSESSCSFIAAESIVVCS